MTKIRRMSRFESIIFDLDGTLTDNTRGIGNSLKYALEKLQTDGYHESVLEQFIGPPLQWGFKNLFGMNERNVELAVEYFREYYGERGYMENEPYPGIGEMLEGLSMSGKKLYVATSKLEKYGRKILDHFEFDRYIIALKGADYGGLKATKTKIIRQLMEAEQIVSSPEVVMIGDTLFDITGGRENGISTIGVDYGFGKSEELGKANPDYQVENVEELYEILNY